MRYLTVGTSEIKEELFYNIEDTNEDNLKPRGGLWLTTHDERYPNYNSWVDFVLDDSTVFFYKYLSKFSWNLPCSLVTLKEDAKIFYLDSNEKLQYLKSMYAADNDKIAYQKMVNDYDGIYIDMFGLLHGDNDSKTRSRILKFGVNSLLLFNLSCIDTYQSGIVAVEPFDFEYGSIEGYNYNIKIEETKKRVLKK